MALEYLVPPNRSWHASKTYSVILLMVVVMVVVVMVVQVLVQVVVKVVVAENTNKKQALQSSFNFWTPSLSAH